MKICFIASANSSHIVKWSGWFASHGHQIDIISFEQDEGVNPYARLHTIPIGFDARKANSLQKVAYLTHGNKLRNIVHKLRPDIINVHYASSYGAAVALSGLSNYILSIWGSDIYNFPRKSIFHRKLLEYSLRKADLLFSTSKTMAQEAKKYSDKKIIITPFGVDTNLFRPYLRKEREAFLVGTVKTLAPKYGIDYLLRAIAILHEEYPEIPLRLQIAGRGEYEEEYKQMAKDLGISTITKWLGFISQEEAAKTWSNFDVAVTPSVEDSESFGVAAVEAQACGTPIIVSDVPGLMEATWPGESSLIVPRKDACALAEAILRLYRDKELRVKMGAIGRKYVVEHYEIDRCFYEIERQFSGFNLRKH